ncbi:hypothetical protein KJ603_00115, partial [Patescibacteria group bacterium]|nr:hypothetical protein [Patescibacteria group bacterium]
MSPSSNLFTFKLYLVFVISGLVQTYNLSAVEDNHNFFAEGILV